MDEDPPQSSPHEKGSLPTTRWSLICAAAGPSTSSARRALDELCRIYWYPLYCFVRRRGYPPADAEDLVQGFFIHLFDRDIFAQADPGRGRLRGFLLSSLRYFLADERKHAAAAKRGGGIEFVPLDLAGAEERYTREPAGGETPEQCYDRRWALLFLQRVTSSLGDRWRERGKADLFTALSPFLFSELKSAEASGVAAKLAMTENNVKQVLHRMRDEFRAIFHQGVLDTVASEAEVQEEMAALRAALL
jgi:RNA polymerase sigma-70 factor (ECF subfamily)